MNTQTTNDLDRHIETMDISALARRFERCAQRTTVAIPRSRAQQILGLLESELHEDARRGQGCAVSYGRVQGALQVCQQLGLIEVEELYRRSRLADELFLRRAA